MTRSKKKYAYTLSAIDSNSKKMCNEGVGTDDKKMVKKRLNG